MKQLALEGIDGSGKSTVIRLLQNELEDQGLRTIVFSPFRLANEQLGHDIYELWFDPETAQTAIDCLAKAVKACRQEAEAVNADVVLYDRHWMTGLVSIADCESAQAYWAEHGPDFVPAALLRTSTAVAIERKCKDDDVDIDAEWMDPKLLQKDADELEKLAVTYPEHMFGIYLSDGTTPEQMAANILWDLNIRR